MDGVTILNAWIETHLTFWFGGVLVVTFVAALISTIATFVIMGVIERRWNNVGAGIVSCIFLALSILASYYIGQPKEVTMCEVTISDDVSFNEFMERYEIIGKRGNIYKVEVKNNA